MAGLKKCLSVMNNAGSSYNGITGKILVIGNGFLNVSNNLLSSDVFSDKQKVSVVMPVPKINKTNKCEEYRPINVVLIYEKLLEMVLKDQVLEYCNRNGLISASQSGFRSGHSCESVLLSISDKLFRGVMHR